MADDVITVLVADDQPLARSGLVALLDGWGRLRIVGEAGDGAEAVRMAHEVRPDVVLMDIRMPRMDGLEATRAICADPALTGTRVVVLTTFDLDEYVFEALRAGATGFLLKHAEPQRIVDAVEVAHAGEALLAPEVTRRLITHVVAGGGPAAAPSPGQRQAVGSLTDREREVVREVALGRSNTEIARAWFVSEATVRTHVSRSMAKLHARDRAQLVVIAYQLGLHRP